ncbi:cytochrome P450 [Temperatibacter marinus]|uniref:Cytochrome P450 n=1 Tax=Temperatibacter marinus TaxID=1456591 RepID=A0AA52H904_9PROT|nr:cytochrome P450 [Temperatibacter marinus]WND02661.1 cytochrome P450 [Temperatibacter marinus]
MTLAKTSQNQSPNLASLKEGPLKEVPLKEVPGENGWPIIGNTFKVLKNPVEYGQKMRAKYGDMYYSNTFFKKVVNVRSPEAYQQILMDRNKDFSSERGWNHWIGKVFPRGLMLLDFDEHKAHRHIMAPAFKTQPMKHYCDVMNQEIPLRIKEWADKEKIEFYPSIKQLSLDLATKVFFGDIDDSLAKKINTSLTDMVLASVAPIRVALPFTQMSKGIKGRKFVSNYIQSEIPNRRAGDGDDIFSHMCRAQDDEGNSFSDQEIIDHMNFLWMAAHDTITSSTTTLVHELARHPEWQDKLRQEIADLGQNEPGVSYDRMHDLPLTECAFKEALRIHPPVPSIARETVRDVEIDGFHIPQGTHIGLMPAATHMDEDIWPEPEKFDPLRFTESGGVKQRHKYAWIPFSGGAHMCIGLHFAYMQSKLIMAHLLPNYELKVPEGYQAEFQMLPLTKPKDGLPITLKKLS